MTTADMAARLVAAQISVIPVKLDGSKVPDGEWKVYQERIASPARLREWFGGSSPKGLGIVAGRVSGNLEVIDFDDLTLAEPWKELIDLERPGLTQRLVLIVTPRPGLQFWYRCEEPVSGNQKLATGLRLENGREKLKTLIETRGEGGYAVAPGSPLSVHLNQTPYRIAGGNPADPPILTAAERELLLRCARALTEAVEPAQERTVRSAPTPRDASELRPGDDFNHREDFRAYLERQGWTVAFQRGEVAYLRRPGKDGPGWSATLGKVAPGVLHVFTTNAAPLEDGCNYDLFRALAAYEYQNDLSAAAAALSARGYGAPPRGRVRAREFSDRDAPPRGDTLTAVHEADRRANEARRKLEGMKNGKHPVPELASPFTAESLMQEELPEPRWAVPGILAEGANMLAGRPKLGKSFLAFNLAIAVASGGKALGSIDVERGEVLYLSLEDTKRRLKRRMKMMLRGEAVPRGLYLVTSWPRMGEENGEGVLEEWIAAHPELRLVIIDTLGRLRGSRNAKAQLYDEDVETIVKLKKIADRFAICILIIHHVRKSTSDDPLEMVSGTYGITGSLDTVTVLTRDRCDLDGSLFVTGRDVDEERYALHFDATIGTWALIGTEEERLKSREREEILRVLLTSPEPMTPAQVAKVLEKSRASMKQAMWRMASDGEILSFGEGKYWRRQVS